MLIQRAAFAHKELAIEMNMNGAKSDDPALASASKKKKTAAVGSVLLACLFVVMAATSRSDGSDGVAMDQAAEPDLTGLRGGTGEAKSGNYGAQRLARKLDVRVLVSFIV